MPTGVVSQWIVDAQMFTYLLLIHKACFCSRLWADNNADFY